MPKRFSSSSLGSASPGGLSNDIDTYILTLESMRTPQMTSMMYARELESSVSRESYNFGIHNTNKRYFGVLDSLINC